MNIKMKICQICIFILNLLNLLNINGLINKVQYKNLNHIKYDKLLLKNSQLENEPFASSEYMVNVGNAIDVLHHELPFIFVLKNQNFDIFSSQIMVVSNTKKISISKHIYIALIKSLQTVASFSKNAPKINVRKIDYIEDTKTIQCLVDIVLPSLIKSHLENKWEGYFYFGVDEKGLIKTHIFDRKISNLDIKLKTVNPCHFMYSNSNHCLNICNKFQSFLKIMRVKSIPPTFLLCFSGGWIMNPSIPNLIKSVPFIVSMINTLLITSASMVINDIFDINVDRINSPHRPLVNGEVTMKEAYLLSLLLLGTSEYLTFKFLPFNLQMIIQMVIVQIILYTPVLKRIFLIKNVSCAGLVSFSIFFNGLASAGNTLLITNKNFGLLSIALSLIFFGSWSNEIILDMRDIEGDKNNKIVTIPTLFGNDFSWLLIHTINNYNIISSSLSMAYLYNSSSIGSVIVVILSPLLVNLYKVKREKYSLESIKNYTQKSNYPLLALIIYLCGLAYVYK
jgi:geranylgeranylglycerol-phosphate geranylgeranyltransferase